VFHPLASFGLARANGAINPSRYKDRFLRKKGVFAIFSRWSRKNVTTGALESWKGRLASISGTATEWSGHGAAGIVPFSAEIAPDFVSITNYF